MKKLIRFILTFALMAIFIGAVAAPQAQANGGCESPVYKANYWYKSQTTTSIPLDPLGPLFEQQAWNYTAVMRYWYCANGAQTDTIKFASVVFCARKGDNNEAGTMEGFSFNAYMSNDNGRWTDPGAKEVDWALGAGNEGTEHCWSQNFTDSPWLWRTTNPYWKFLVKVRHLFQPDDTVLFTSNGTDRKYLNYNNDPNVWILF